MSNMARQVTKLPDDHTRSGLLDNILSNSVWSPDCDLILHLRRQLDQMSITGLQNLWLVVQQKMNDAEADA